MLVGAHVPVSAGYDKAIEYASSVGAECAQLFLRNPRQWRSGPPQAASVRAFRDARARYSFGPVFSHTAYLINLATPNEDLRQMSITALAEELVRAGAFGVDGVVTHLGSRGTHGVEEATALAADSILQARRIAGDGGGTTLLVENSAGAGNSFGCCFDEICGVLDACHKEAGPLGIAFDLCHAQAYGTDVSTDEGWKDLLDGLDGLCGTGELKLLHANDSAFARGERRDRHAWVGDGTIGLEGFEVMLNEPRLQQACAVTELQGERPFKDAENIRRLKSLRR